MAPKQDANLKALAQEEEEPGLSPLVGLMHLASPVPSSTSCPLAGRSKVWEGGTYL